MLPITRPLAALALSAAALALATGAGTTDAGAAPAPFHPDARPVAPTVRSNAVRPGAFCRTSDAGRTERAANGTTVRCATTATDARHRWRTVVK